MVQTIFVTGIGTGIGKTVVAAILAEALQADYWKPVQAGYEDGTDSDWMRSVIQNNRTKIYPEVYRLKMPASPHLAAKNENRTISLEKIFTAFAQCVAPGRRLVIEGAGGLLVPLNEHELVIDLIRKLNAKVVLVSRHYLGSINHSLLTAQACRQKNIRVAGWIFNDRNEIYGEDYENDIVQWSGFPRIASIGQMKNLSGPDISKVAVEVKEKLTQLF